MMLATTVRFLALVGAVQCLPWDGIKPTGVFNKLPGFQEPPKTTQPARLELHRRQAPGDATCGYENGLSSAALYCLSQAVCATNSLGGMGCCYSTGLDNCLLPTACIDSTALGDFDATYLANPYLASCTASSAPLCITQYFSYNVVATGFDCGNSASYLTEYFYTTATNTTVPSISVFNAFYSPIPTPTFSTSSSSQSQSSTSSLTSTSSSSPSPTPTPTPNPTPTPTPTPTPAPSSSSTPVGAIVGGVVGGVAVIAIVALVVFFLLRRNKKQNEPQPQYPVVASMQQTQGSPPQPQQMYPQQPQQYQYPSPSSMQPPPQNYPSAAYQTSYADKMATQNNAYQVYGSPQFSHNEPVGAGSERMSVVPPYSPDPSSAGGFEGKSNTAVLLHSPETVHELSEQNR